MEVPQRVSKAWEHLQALQLVEKCLQVKVRIVQLEALILVFKSKVVAPLSSVSFSDQGREATDEELLTVHT